METYESAPPPRTTSLRLPYQRYRLPPIYTYRLPLSHAKASTPLMVKRAEPQEYSEKSAPAAHAGRQELIHGALRLLRCPSCLQRFTNPVTLSCDHTLCRACLPEPVARANISYPNTPDRLLGITCPVPSCHAEHAAAECSVNVTLTKLIERFTRDVGEWIWDRMPEYQQEMPEDHDMLLREKETPEPTGNSGVLQGGRFAAMVGSPFNPEVQYETVSSARDDATLETEMLKRMRDATLKELDCQVCYNLMLDATTTPCGHTFCRGCLARAMDHSNICPVCRRVLHIPASLEDTPSNTILNLLLNILCQDVVEARQRAVEAEEQGVDDDLNTPLFICTLSLPTMPTFLHVFEPRYRLMMRRAMDGNRQFGMVMYNRASAPQGDMGPTQFLEYGTMLEITNMEVLPDGRSFVETRGVGRFKVRRHGMVDGYHIARVERIEDVSLAEEGMREQDEITSARITAAQFQQNHPEQALPLEVAMDLFSTQELLDSCMAFIRQMRSANTSWLNARIVQVYGEPSEDPAIFPYWFASVVPIAEEEKYKMLPTNRVRERLKIVYSWIRRIQAQRWTGGSACTIL